MLPTISSEITNSIIPIDTGFAKTNEMVEKVNFIKPFAQNNPKSTKASALVPGNCRAFFCYKLKVKI